MNKEKKLRIEQATQQFIGFSKGYYFQDIVGLVMSMNLEKWEFDYLLDNEMLSIIEEKEINEIKEHFEEESGANK